MFVLAWAAAALPAAAASDRFVPADPRFVVANVRQATPDAELRELISDWRTQPSDQASHDLAAAFIRRAHENREPMYMGRAEAVLLAARARVDASDATRLLYAQTLQYRHEFAAAEELLDAILVRSPRDAGARTQRASVRLVRGDFTGARADCAQLLGSAGGNRTVALACLAEALAGMGQLKEARQLLGAYRLDAREVASARAYLLTVRAELSDRAAAHDDALSDYSAALALTPYDDSIRAALADVLIERRSLEAASRMLSVEKPSLSLLVRRLASGRGAERERLRAQAVGWLELENARGDLPHYREAALFALQTGDLEGAVQAARRNFATQKELADVRVLARAAVAARDSAAKLELITWLHASGFADATTKGILDAAPRS